MRLMPHGLWRWVLGLGLALTPAVTARGQVDDDTGFQLNPRPARPPATRPDNPAPVPKASIERWFGDLANTDESLREQARQNLMFLTRGDLPALREVVADNRPLLPGQSAVLREVVEQAFLAGDNTDPSPQGFLGVRFDENQDDGAGPGVEIRHRMPGFCACRMLQDGDVVLAITSPPNPAMPVRNTRDIQLIIRASGAGQTVLMDINRRGRAMRVPVKLDGRPRELDSGGIPGNGSQQMLDRRAAEADEYWQKNFAPLLEGKVL